MKHLAHLLNRTQPVQGPVVRARLLSAWVGIQEFGSASSFATRTITTMNGMDPGEGSA